VIRQRDIREALAWVDATGAVPILRSLVRPTGRGRPRQLPVRTLLVGIKLAIDTAKTACLADVHPVLLDLPRSVQRQLAVRDPRTGREISVHQVRRGISEPTHVLDDPLRSQRFVEVVDMCPGLGFEHGIRPASQPDAHDTRVDASGQATENSDGRPDDVGYVVQDIGRQPFGKGALVHRFGEPITARTTASVPERFGYRLRPVMQARSPSMRPRVIEECGEAHLRIPRRRSRATGMMLRCS
jgi:hypothetical protein